MERVSDPGKRDLWIRRFHPSVSAKARLVCLPHAGGSASFFFPVSRALSPAVEVLSVQYPGRQDRRTENPIESITELADAVTRELLSWADRPLALFGHSMGAVLAFEIVRRLEDRGVLPLILFASGRRAPSCGRVKQVHLLDDDGLIAEITVLAGTSLQILGDKEIMRMALPSIRSDYKAVETYRWQPGSLVRSPIHVHVGNDDPRVPVGEARMWEQHTAGDFFLTTYPGGHFYLVDQSTLVTENLSRAIAVRLSDRDTRHDQPKPPQPRALR
ncbi:thioesterase II family protein [Frankia sp. CiP3]|uniref:thioesterase II family protein n=1 Tax=Frankia sp. CiP3 TaxID=2880971 RepID=UPI001EF6CFAB|nr:alpha/beta fold hydrolase [Frankia sp. CiP3]